jgi:HPt (histidine-containing phosphotransfer) domain-containing protein
LQELEVEIPRLKKRIAATDKRLQDEKYDQPDADIDLVFESLDEIEEAIREMESNAKRFQHYQQVC